MVTGVVVGALVGSRNSLIAIHAGDRPTETYINVLLGRMLAILSSLICSDHQLPFMSRSVFHRTKSSVLRCPHYGQPEKVGDCVIAVPPRWHRRGLRESKRKFADPCRSDQRMRSKTIGGHGLGLVWSGPDSQNQLSNMEIYIS